MEKALDTILTRAYWPARFNWVQTMAWSENRPSWPDQTTSLSNDIFIKRQPDRTRPDQTKPKRQPRSNAVVRHRTVIRAVYQSGLSSSGPITGPIEQQPGEGNGQYPLW